MILSAPNSKCHKNGITRKSGCFTPFGTPLKSTVARFSIKKETPIAPISAEIRGA